MTITTTYTAGNMMSQFCEYTSLLFNLAKKEDTDVNDRIRKVQEMTDAYIEQRGERPDVTQLDRLSSLILRNELTDMNEYKMSHNEYPIMSERQQERRHKTEISEVWAESVAQDGRDYRPKTRDYLRKLREISE